MLVYLLHRQLIRADTPAPAPAYAAATSEAIQGFQALELQENYRRGHLTRFQHAKETGANYIERVFAIALKRPSACNTYVLANSL